MDLCGGKKSCPQGEIMEAVTTKLQEAINQLVVICRDGEHGFEAAANAVSDDILKAELMQYSRQRAEFCVELEDVRDALGGSADNRGSFSGMLHLGWLNIGKSIEGHDEHAILRECEEGEQDAVETYREVLGFPLPSLVGEMIASQYQAVRRVRDRIRMLRDKVGKS
jgi:uncharacterized protein (TIGR02284 family)